jgi:hypothetical protein
VIQPRNGNFARFGGRDYRSTQIQADGTVRLFHDSAQPPDDSRFAKHPTADIWQLRVAVAEVERLAQVSTIARYRDSEVHVDAVDEDGIADLYFMRHALGTSGPPAGFEQVGKWEFRARVPVSELRDYHEKHLDLLFDHHRSTAG